MQRVRTGTAVAGPCLLSSVCLLGLLGGLARTTGLGQAAWASGIAYGVVLATLLWRSGRRLGPADYVTLSRAVIIGGIAALVVDSFQSSVSVPLLVTMSAVALVLDNVDGRVARHTGSASAYGARFDVETDAFLLLVLSVYVGRDVGWWVLAIGLLRYGFVAAQGLVPWLRATAPTRPWCKVVAAIQGVCLTVAAADVLPASVTRLMLLASLALLAESFGHEIWDLWRLARGHEVVRLPREQARGRVWLALACAVVWCALLAPNRGTDLSSAAFLRVPVDGLLFVALLLVLPRRPARVVAVIGGVLLGVLTLSKALDVGFFTAFDRPWDVMYDVTYADSGFIVLSDSVGRAAAWGIVAAALLALVAVLLLTTAATVRVSAMVTRHRMRALPVVAALGLVAAGLAAAGVRVDGRSVASASTAHVAYLHAAQIPEDLTDRKAFSRQIAHDPFKDVPAEGLLGKLRGKDVLIVFVESYGRVSVEDNEVGRRVLPALREGSRRLSRAGYLASSAFFTSPTYGGISWLAHSTLQSGLWVDRERRYADLLERDRFTLSRAFARAGWRTVADVPSNLQPWPEGERFYGYDTIYNGTNVGYRGPHFGYAKVPDQFTLDVFGRKELAPAHRPPVMAEIDLVSSHTPWAPLPRMVPWSALGDGSVYDPMPGQQPTADEVWSKQSQVRRAFADSVVYSFDALLGWLERSDDDNLVLLVLGDHQPSAVVSGEGAGHDVPVTLISRDRSVIRAAAPWQWQPGLVPDADAPAWPMSAFRDRFLTTYSTGATAQVRTPGE